VGKGVLNGYADGTMRPLNPVTRQAGMAALYRLRTVMFLDEAWAEFLVYAGWDD